MLSLVGIASILAGGCSKWREEREAKMAADAAQAKAVAATLPAVPDEIAVNARRITIVHATGNQIYSWDGSAWKLKAPAAKFSDAAFISGTHSAGPSWNFDGGGKITAKKIKDVASDDAGAVPWLLLEVTANDAPGILADAKYIQRINTVGGKAPETPGHKAGDEVRVPYAADYVFRAEEMKTPAAMSATMPSTQPALP
jgi:hypothetical protein